MQYHSSIMESLFMSSLISVVALMLIFIYVLRNNCRIHTTPFVIDNWYPIVGHLFAFVADRTKFIMDYHQKYGQCFRVNLFSQQITFILSPCDWRAIFRNKSFYFPGPEFAAKAFSISTDCFGKFTRSEILEVAFYLNFILKKFSNIPIFTLLDRVQFDTLLYQ